MTVETMVASIATMAIDAMIGMIEPAMTVISGVIMGWIVAGVMGPIYDSLSKMV